MATTTTNTTVLEIDGIAPLRMALLVVQNGAWSEQIWLGFDLSAFCVVKNNENSERFCRGKWIFSRVKWE